MNASAPVVSPSLAFHRTRARIPSFEFRSPYSFAEARQMLDETPGAIPLAGGLDVVNRMKEGIAPTALVWLGRIAGEDIIERRGHELVAGALVRHDQMAGSPVLQAYFPALAAAWGHLANIRIRCQGTIVGNVVARMPGYEAANLLAASGGRLIGLKPGGECFDVTVAGLTNLDGSARACPGLVTEFRIPLAPPGQSRRLAYDRALRPALSVALGLDLIEGRVAAARAVLGGTHASPLVRLLAAQGLSLSELRRGAADLARQAFADLPLHTALYDGRSNYQFRVAPVLLARLIEEVAI